jgi:hypothetical protein
MLLLRMRGVFTGEAQYQLLVGLLLGSSFVTLPAIATAHTAFIFSTGGVLLVSGSAAAVSLLYFFFAQRIYLRGDLIRRAV